MDYTSKVEQAALNLVVNSSGGLSPESVRDQLATSFPSDEVRTAVANLWDRGLVNVGSDRKLHATPKG